MCSETGSATTAIVTNVQRYALPDGGGIPTGAFLNGCPCLSPASVSRPLA